MNDTRTIDAPVAHGYTLDDIDRLAVAVLRADRWNSLPRSRDRHDAVWHAIVEHLLAAQTPPARNDLLAVGTRASNDHVRDEMHHHGRSERHTGDAMRGYERYWATAPASSVESQVVERVACAQILPHLTVKQRAAIWALYEFDDCKLGADALGVTAANFQHLLQLGRHRFLELWHEGERPSTPWRASRPAPRPRDRFGKRRITESQLEAIRERYHAGETQGALAAEFGVAQATVSALLRGASRPAQDRVETKGN